MKSGIHKRFYTVLPRPPPTSSSPQASPAHHVSPSPAHHVRPRPRANSASLYTSSSLLPLSFFDSPPPPQSRLPSSPPRLPPEPKQHSQPNPLALTPSPPAAPDTHALFQYPALAYTAPPAPYTPSPTVSPAQLPLRQKRLHPRYQLDVGAYGIPKRCKAHSRRTFPDDSSLAVQVGEDAYFVRDNAMGVADGVGGWARLSPPEQSACTPSPSALFARRLMHYTSAEIAAEPDPRPPPEPATELDTHLAELSDGIDVLQILERAYDKTVKAHVRPATAEPLATGSSTALVAVLDHVRAPPDTTPTQHPSPAPSPPGPAPPDRPVLKIAHIGDCMGMLVRGDEIVWRSEEMWWAFNTPVQLSPYRPSAAPSPSPPRPALFPNTSFLSQPLFSTPPVPRPRPPSPIHSPSPKITPKSAARLFTLPVHPNDILILASDGLSDNLWDEDVLDEVVRFRRAFLDSAGAVDAAQSLPLHTTPAKQPVSVATATASFTTPLFPPPTVIEADLTPPTIGTAAVDASSPSTIPSRCPPSKPATKLIPSAPIAAITTTTALRRQTMAGMLSEALCSRARQVSERKGRTKGYVPELGSGLHASSNDGASDTKVVDDVSLGSTLNGREDASGVAPAAPVPPADPVQKPFQAQPSSDPFEVPFARRARELGRAFSGGKRDDISVLVAVISPSPSIAPESESLPVSTAPNDVEGNGDTERRGFQDGDLTTRPFDG